MNRSQITIVGFFVATMLVVGVEKILQLEKRQHEVAEILRLIDHELQNSTSLGETCTEYPTVKRLLENIHILHRVPSNWLKPANEFLESNPSDIREDVLKAAFQDVIFAGVACKIIAREGSMIVGNWTDADPLNRIGSVDVMSTHIHNHLKDIVKNHHAIGFWNSIAENLGDQSGARLESFNSLLKITYDQGLPQEVWHSERSVIEILKYVELDKFDSHPERKRMKKINPSFDPYKSIGQNVERMGEELEFRIVNAIDIGPMLMAKIHSNEADVADIRRFAGWLDWIEQDWLVAEGELTKCERNSRLYANDLATIKTFQEYEGKLDYSKLPGSVGETCRDMVEEKLATQRMEPLANVIIPISQRASQLVPQISLEAASPSQASAVEMGVGEVTAVIDDSIDYVLSPNWKQQKRFLSELSELEFMQLGGRRDLSCNPYSTGYNRSKLLEMEAHMEEFRDFLNKSIAQAEIENLTFKNQRMVDPRANQPYKQVGKANLARVLNAIASEDQQNQTPLSSRIQKGVNVNNREEVRVRDTYTKFNNDLAKISDVIELYVTLDMRDEGRDFVYCTQKFAHRELQKISKIAKTSHQFGPRKE